MVCLPHNNCILGAQINNTINQWKNKDHALYFVLFCAGVRLGLFTPDLAFDVVARKQIDRLRQPVLLMVDLVSQEVNKVVQHSAQQVYTATHTKMWCDDDRFLLVGGLALIVVYFDKINIFINNANVLLLTIIKYDYYILHLKPIACFSWWVLSEKL